MTETDYAKYIIKEPLAVGRFSPIVHICGEKHRFGNGDCPGSIFPDFPVEQTLMYITEPFLMNTPTHAHDHDQLLYVLGGNPANFFDFDAEIEITLGDLGEKNTVNTTSIVYIPKGMMHCPVNFKIINKPIIFGHLSFASGYSRSSGDRTEDTPIYDTYPEEEIARLKKGGVG